MLVHHAGDDALDLQVVQPLAFLLRVELRLRHLHADDHRQPSRKSSPIGETFLNSPPSCRRRSACASGPCGSRSGACRRSSCRRCWCSSGRAPPRRACTAWPPPPAPDRPSSRCRSAGCSTSSVRLMYLTNSARPPSYLKISSLPVRSSCKLSVSPLLRKASSRSRSLQGVVVESHLVEDFRVGLEA